DVTGAHLQLTVTVVPDVAARYVQLNEQVIGTFGRAMAALPVEAERRQGAHTDEYRAELNPLHPGPEAIRRPVGNRVEQRQDALAPRIEPVPRRQIDGLENGVRNAGTTLRRRSGQFSVWQGQNRLDSGVAFLL